MPPPPPPGPQIVHKQFNSPLGLYSQQNIRETLDRHLHHLDNGTVGIDFRSGGAPHHPPSLANSAVLRLLEEEEQQARRSHQRGSSGQKKVVWPPTPESNGYHQPAQQQQQPPHYQPQPQPQPAYRPQPPQYGAQSQSQPAPCEGRRQEQCGLSKLIPVTKTSLPSSPARSPGRSPAASRWAPVPSPSPISPQLHKGFGHQPQPQPQPQSQPAAAYSETTFEEATYQGYPAGFGAGGGTGGGVSWARSPPPASVTLRQSAPVHQLPPPVYASQPAAQSFRGGVHMRGDQKWPPAPVRAAVEAENEARRELARGPACRPRKVKKDYSSFFAAHALTGCYPPYRAPPGTQHYNDLGPRSSY